jgi:cellulose synthase operon protein C
VSTNDKGNKNQGTPVPEWDSAIDEWDKATVDPSPAEDKTPAPPDLAEASSKMPDKPVTPKAAPATGGLDSIDVDDDSTVVAKIPDDLIAESVRGTGGAAGLGQMFGRKDEELIPIVDDSLITSAVALGVPESPLSGAVPAPEEKKDEPAVPDGEMFDPFSDLRDKPVKRPPRPPAPPRPAARPSASPQPPKAAGKLPPPTGKVSGKTTPLPKAEGKGLPQLPKPVLPPPPAVLDLGKSEEVAAPEPAAAPPPPALFESKPAVPAPEPAKAVETEAMFAAPVVAAPGPKLLEPEERQFSSDEETAVLDKDRLEKEIDAVAKGAAAEVAPMGDAKTEPPPSMPELAASPSPSAQAPRAQSMAPPPLAEIKPQWADERDCAGHLLDAGKREEWSKRAAWLAEEAAANQDKAEKSSLLLAVSELHAMLAEDDRASGAAKEARDLAPNHPLIQRQTRATLVRDRSWTELLPMLDVETRQAPTADARAHGALMQAEIIARVQGEPEAANKQIDLAARVLPSDPRAHIEKFVRGLAHAHDTAPKFHLPEGDDLEPLAQAFKEITRIRLADKGGSADKPSHYEVIPLARAALLAFDTSSAARALRSLDDVRGLGPGAAWLSASLASQKDETRPEAERAYAELSAGPHAAVARRLRALRAVELGDHKALDETLEGGSEAFAAIDRAALATLFGTELAVARPFIKSVLDQASTAPLGAAATCATEEVVDNAARAGCAIGAWSFKATASVARSVLGLKESDAFADRISTMREKCPDSEVARLLGLECDVAAGRNESIVGALSSWASAGSGGGDADRDRALAAGLAAEALGDKSRARSEYEKALGADPSNASCSRVLMSFDKDTASARLIDLARSSQDDTRASLYMLEGAIREGQDHDDYDSHLRRAQELAPKLPLAAFLGERRARSRGDVDLTLEWLRMRREANEDPVEAAYDQCREAMLMVERDASLAASTLESASAARPADMALRELYERFASDRRGEDWVSWRVERAAELQGEDKARLLLEATLEVERRGSAEQAGKLAAQAVESGSGDMAVLCAERAEFAGAGTTTVADKLMEQARSETNQPRERREARERLAELDEIGRNDQASALLWHRAILEESPQHLPSLRKLEQSYIGEGREEDFEPIAAELAKVVVGPEADAHAMVGARIRLRESAWTATKDLVEAAAGQARPSIWALRQMLAHERAVSNDHGIVQAATALAERTDRDAEAAALMAVAAEAHARMGENRVAAELMASAIEREPRLFDAHAKLVDMLKAAGDSARAADELEKLARKSTVAQYRLEFWYRAATMWLDELKDTDRGRKALEEASDIDIAYADVFPRLQAIYIEAGERTELAALLERRLEAITDPAERVEMEVLRGKALADVGETDAAKEALSAALDASPDHVPALQAFAKLCSDADDWEGAEQSLIRLARHVPDAEQQAAIYRQLGDIYVNRLPNMERAELVLLEVLKRQPEDQQAQSKLVDVYRETGNAAKAIELCTGLQQRASTPELKRAATIQLALIHEQVEGDMKKAETMLEKVHKEAPTNMDGLRALAEFHKRQNHLPALKMLLDRAANDARRSLGTGRFNPELFGVLTAVGELRGKQDAALVAGAAIGALEGNAVEIGAGGAAVFKTELDDLIAPPILTEPLRNLLRLAGDVLEVAFPIDLKSIRATKFPPTAEQLEQAIQNTGAVFGLSSLEVFVSPAIGPTCMPLGSNPPKIVLGASLIAASEEEVRDFLILRALKILQVRGSVLSRTAPIDLLPMITALVKCLCPSYTPTAVDQKRFDDCKQRIMQHLPKPTPPDLGSIATEVSGSIDNRISTVNVAINSWGSRAALLASGALLAAIKGIAWAGGHPSGPPVSGAERATWIGRNAEARELLVFTVSDAFLEARLRLGISQDQ